MLPPCVFEMGWDHREVYMENQTFDVLEEKIIKILSMLDQLKNENQKLKQKNQELQALVKEREEDIQRLKTESESFDGMKIEIETYKEKQDRIRAKVEKLLEKLKEFEDIH